MTPLMLQLWTMNSQLQEIKLEVWDVRIVRNNIANEKIVKSAHVTQYIFNFSCVKPLCPCHLQQIKSGRNINVWKEALLSLKPLNQKKLICFFTNPLDRDRLKATSSTYLTYRSTKHTVEVYNVQECIAETYLSNWQFSLQHVRPWTRSGSGSLDRVCSAETSFSFCMSLWSSSTWVCSPSTVSVSLPSGNTPLKACYPWPDAFIYQHVWSVTPRSSSEPLCSPAPVFGFSAPGLVRLNPAARRV